MLEALQDGSGQSTIVHGGWTLGSGTWTYASATTFTVPAADAGAMAVGTKIWLTQTTSKYFYVTGVSGTTITVTGGSDYSLANAAITAPYYSNATTPYGFPDYFNYTPTWTNLTVGNGTNSSRFTMKGKTVKFRVGFVLGSTSSVGTGPRVSLPVTTSSNLVDGDILARGTIIDQGSAYYDAELMWATTTAADLYVLAVAASYATKANPSSTIPMTWATIDSIKLIGEYEAA